MALIWHGIVQILLRFFKRETMINFDIFMLFVLGLFYFFSHIWLMIWMNSALATRRFLDKRDDRFLKAKCHVLQEGTNMSQDNIVEEAAEPDGKQLNFVFTIILN